MSSLLYNMCQRKFANVLNNPQPGGGETQVPQMEQQLYAAVSSTSSWLDGVENNVFSGSVLLAENTETQLQEQEVQSGLFKTVSLIIVEGFRQQITELGPSAEVIIR